MNRQRFLVLLVIGVLIVGYVIKRKWRDGHTGQLRIGVSQITSHLVFDEVRKGMVSKFAQQGYHDGKEIIFDFQNAQGDMSVNQSIAQQLANGNYDLVITLGTQASQAVANIIKTKPVVFGFVTDPVSAGLVDSFEHPGRNMTGTSDITLYREQLDLIKKLVPTAKRVGIVYNPGEANAKYALEQVTALSKPLGFEIVTSPANDSGSVIGAAKAIVGDIDVMYMLPDNTVISAQEALIQVAIEAKKPFISLDGTAVEKGALATLGTNYTIVGERTADVALRVIKGEAPTSIPVVGVTDADLYVNLKTAQAIGMTIPDDLLNNAKYIYR